MSLVRRSRVATDADRPIVNRQVKSGVEDHVKDFRGQLTSEV